MWKPYFAGILCAALLTNVNAGEEVTKGRPRKAVERQPTRVCNQTSWQCHEDCVGLESGLHQWCGACHECLYCQNDMTLFFTCTGDWWYDGTIERCKERPSETCFECWSEACGGLLHHMKNYKYELPEGWNAMCYITKSDTDLADKPCAELIKDMNQVGGGAQEFLDAGGNFGCWRGKEGLNGNYNDGCRELYQHDADLNSCEDCDIMAVCIKNP